MYCQVVPCPGKKASAAPKKAAISLCLRSCIRNQEGRTGKICPGPFLASAPAFLPGQQEEGSKRPTELGVIQNYYSIQWEFGRATKSWRTVRELTGTIIRKLECSKRQKEGLEEEAKEPGNIIKIR